MWRKQAPTEKQAEKSTATTTPTTTSNTLGRTRDCLRPSPALRRPRDRNSKPAEPTGKIQIPEKERNAFHARPRRTQEEIGELRKKGILGK